MTLKDFYKKSFAGLPDVSAGASGRVNLIGEHIDYNGGTVLPAAIHLYVQVALGYNDCGQNRIVSAQFDGFDKRLPGTGRQGLWSDYAAGALEKAAQLGVLKGTVDVAIESTIPDGAGLSSSSALVAAVLRACCKLTGCQIEPKDMALASKAVENDYIGMPCGIMDQMAIALTEPGQALALDTAGLDYERIAIPEEFTFPILHSGVHRKLSDGRYKTRFEECADARAALGAQHLCHLNEAQVTQISSLPENLSARTRHVVSEHQRTLSAIMAMRVSDITQLGRLMSESHASYSCDFAASTPEIDALVADCVALGAYGARLTGGGFGGCIVALGPSGFAEDWSKDVLKRHPSARRIL